MKVSQGAEGSARMHPDIIEAVDMTELAELVEDDDGDRDRSSDAPGEDLG